MRRRPDSCPTVVVESSHFACFFATPSMELLSFLTILHPGLQAVALASSSDLSPSSFVALIAILMFFAGLVFLAGDLHRWQAVRKHRRNLPGWRKG